MSLRPVSLALAAAVLAATLAASCGAPPDEAWLRFLGFRATDATTNLTVLSGKLRDGTTDSADAAFENGSVIVGKTGGGTGVLVYRARVQYRMSGFAPPAMDYPVTLYLPAGAAATGTDAAAAAATGVLADFPIAPATLKNWLLETHAFEDATLTPSVELQAVVTFYGVTDEDVDLVTTGAIAVSLANTP
jgi:hypothetical protein